MDPRHYHSMRPEVAKQKKLPFGQLNPIQDRWGAKSIDISWDKKRLKALLSALIGTVVEHYDYALYGYMAAIFADNYFPKTDSTTALLKVFLVFALGFMTKPIGAYIFGKIGDKHGRKYALGWSILGIALPTFLIGCLPSYIQWSWKSTACLVILRMVQGMFISAERDGVGIFIYESMPKHRACLANSLVWVTGTFGNGLAAFIAGSSILANMQQRFQWAWRTPFLLAGIFGILVFILRTYLIESYDYILYKVSNKTVKQLDTSFGNVLYRNMKAVCLGIILTGSMGGSYYFYAIFWNTYLHKILNVISYTQSCNRSFILMIVYIIIAPICGLISDRFHILKTLRLATLLSLIALALNAYMININQAPLWVLIFTGCSFALFHVPVYVLLMKMFKINERYRCMSMSHAIGTALFSSTTPIVANYFWDYFRNPAAPIFYCGFLVGLGFIIACITRLSPETEFSYDAHASLTKEQYEAFIDNQPMFEINFNK